MKRILIVEDDMALAQELQYLLISNQYDAQRVEEFTDVAGQILASQADMVLLDINLPEVDGQSVLRELRKNIGYSGHYGDKQKHRDGRSDLDEFRCG